MISSIPQIKKWGISQAGNWIPERYNFTQNGKPVTWKGFSAFPLMNLSTDEAKVCLRYYPGYNIARVWTSVTWNPPNTWDYPSNEKAYDFLQRMRDWGYQVELTLCTDKRADRLDQARALVEYLNATDIDNLVLEAVNEPGVHDKHDPYIFKSLLEQSRFRYTSGIYMPDINKHFGHYWNDHSSRDAEWFRKGGHNLYEANKTGGGPNHEQERPLNIAAIEDEPGKWQDVGFDLLGIYSYAASCVILGAGATCHTEYGKLCTGAPSSNDLNWIRVFLEGLNIFPAGSYNGSYDRIEEAGQPSYARTYVTDKYSIRIKQKGKEHQESGWIPLDTEGICWVRA